MCRLGTKYGKFDMAETLFGKNDFSRDCFNGRRSSLVEQLKTMVEDGTVSLCVDMYTDDYRKKSYLDVHAVWVDREYSVLTVRHFGTAAHTGANICSAVNGILAEYNLSEQDTPVTTDHGSNIVAALKKQCSVRLHVPSYPYSTRDGVA